MMRPAEFFREHCGRYAWLFFATMFGLVLFLCLATLGKFFFFWLTTSFPSGGPEDLTAMGMVALLALGVLVLGFWVVARFRRGRRPGRYEVKPWSRDELAKARSKLTGTRKSNKV